ISEKLKKACPELALGVIQAQVKVGPGSKALWKKIKAEVAATKKGHSLEGLSGLPEIEAVRKTYRALGKEPGRYRGSAEALIRRIIQGKGLYKVNGPVDINNLVSVTTRHPVGTYNLAAIEGPIVFGVGEPGESYKGIGKETINIAGLPVFKDDQGPYGSPTSDSERAMITDGTTRILMVIISFTGEGLEEGIKLASELLKEFSEATIEETTIIT
ncbi:hypothetical protein KKC60_02985, partial [Patescibacteria group bacterium]|nr:hypothetical protein [Patescibacteria group bacterium]